MAAQQFTYVPSFDATPPARPSSPPEEPAEYYRYDAGNAGRLTSALPTYQPGYAPFPVYPANVAYFPVSYTTPNVPVHWLSTFYADNPATAPVFLTYPQPSASSSPSKPKKAAVPAGVAWQGSTTSEIDMQHRATHASDARAQQFVPYEPSEYQQFYCRELDGSYTLRTTKDIEDNLNPGYWKAGKKGVPYWVRVLKEDK